jgi:hypothetical protein
LIRLVGVDRIRALFQPVVTVRGDYCHRGLSLAPVGHRVVLGQLARREFEWRPVFIAVSILQGFSEA